MAYSLILLNYRLVRLVILVLAGGLALVVQEQFGLIQVFLVTRYQIEFGQRHLGYLMSGNHHLLVRTVTDLTAYTVGIADGYIQELAASGGLIVGYGTFYHVAQVIELMATALLGTPAGRA